MERFILTNKIGVVAESNDVNGLKKAIGEILDCDYAMFENNLTTARKEYNWATQEKVLLSEYARISK